MAEAYPPAPPAGGGTDEYRCQVIDPGLTKAAFLTGTQFMPEPGSLLVLQIHYDLLATDFKPAGSDRSAVRLRLTDGTPRGINAGLRLIGDHGRQSIDRKGAGPRAHHDRG